MSSTVKDYKNLILGILIVLLFLLQLFIWLKLDNSPATWDPANHLKHNLDYFNLLSHPGFKALKKIIYLSVYPPLVGLSLFPFYLFFGESADKAIFFQNLIYIPILAIATCLIVKKTNPKQTGGILSILLLLTYPQIYVISNKFFLDIPLTAMVSLSIYGLLSAEYFTSRKKSVLLGIFLGLGLLTKKPFVIFLFGPFIVTTFFSLKDGRISGTATKRIKNILISLLIALLTAALWYLPNLKRLLSYSLHAAITEGTTRGQPFPLSLKSIQFYIFSLVNEQLFCFYIALFIVGLVFFVKKIRREKLVVISWIIVPYLILTFCFYLKQTRYLLPALPAFAVITSIGISCLSKKYRQLLVTPIILIALLQLSAQNFGIKIISKDLTVPFFGGQRLILFKNSGLNNAPNNAGWELHKPLFAVHQDIQENRENDAKIIVFANTAYYNQLTLRYYSTANDLNLEIKKSQLMDKEYLYDLMENDSYKYFLFKTWPNHGPASERPIYLKAIQFIYSYPERFKKIFTQLNPDGSFAFIYKRVMPVTTYRNNEIIKNKFTAPIKVKSLSTDSSNIDIRFEGGVPPYAIEWYPLNYSGKLFKNIGNRQKYNWEITEFEKKYILEGGGIAVKVVDFLGNESNYHNRQIK